MLLLKTTRKTMIVYCVMSILLGMSSPVMADCGVWKVTSKVCATDFDPYVVCSVEWPACPVCVVIGGDGVLTKIKRCSSPPWYEPDGLACTAGPYPQRIVTEIKVCDDDQPCQCVDGTTRACETSEGCPGNQICVCGKWEECKEKDVCCVSPD